MIILLKPGEILIYTRKSTITNFNETLQDIRHNEIFIKSEIIQLNHLIADIVNNQNIHFAKDLV